jgi:hypothetical protein
MNNFTKSAVFLLIILVLALGMAPYNIDGFHNNHYKNNLKTPFGSETQAILDDYPQIGKNQVSNESASTMWWHYPIFSLPSFKQQTNNLRYYNNPDEGTCTRAEFCGALYHSKPNNSNEVYPLPPATEGPGARVGYFRAEPNYLYYSIPTNENILY